MERALREKLPNGRFSVTASRSRQMATIKGRGNRTTERRLRAALVAAGIAGWQIAPSDILSRPDFYFRDKRTAVFVDGCFWHGCSQCGHIPNTNRPFWEAKIDCTRARDSRTTAELHAAGIRVLRFWEHDLAKNLSGCVRSIAISLALSDDSRLTLERRASVTRDMIP